MTHDTEEVFAPLPPYSASHWSFMAHLSAKHLQAVIHVGEIGSQAFPRGVHADLVNFFDPIVDYLGGEPFDHPLIPVMSYYMAKDLLIASRKDPAMDRDERRQRLANMACFANSLLVPRVLEPDEIEIATDLMKFLVELHTRGESEAYVRVVRDIY